MPDLIEPEHAFPPGAGAPAVQLLDVRAPIEVARCAIPGAISAPILNDDERQQVGACYHGAGHEAAYRLGIELTRDRRAARVAAWRRAADEAPGPAAFACWRGGDRSRLAQEWLGDPQVARVRGGTKALRGFLMRRLVESLQQVPCVVLAGLTGSGKTAQLRQLLVRQAEEVAAANGQAERSPVHAVDLEGLARHRGSSFGRMSGEQPAQQTFENQIAASVQLAAPRVLLLEDEGCNVGAVQLPEELWRTIKRSPVVFVEAPMEQRVAEIAAEYVFEPTHASSRAAVLERLLGDLVRLRKRLGGQRLQHCTAALQAADDDTRWLTAAAHEPWIRTLLEGYYDPLYARSMASLDRPVLFRGSSAEVQAWLAGDGLARHAEAGPERS